jgi:hypothetical protein
MADDFGLLRGAVSVKLRVAYGTQSISSLRRPLLVVRQLAWPLWSLDTGPDERPHIFSRQFRVACRAVCFRPGTFVPGMKKRSERKTRCGGSSNKKQGASVKSRASRLSQGESPAPISLVPALVNVGTGIFVIDWRTRGKIKRGDAHGFQRGDRQSTFGKAEGTVPSG